MIISGTGHRPDKLGGYTEEAHKFLVKLAVIWLKKYKPSKVIIGMAMGWDLALGEAAIFCEIPLICAVPFAGFHNKWSNLYKYKYELILSLAEKVVYVTEGGYEVWKLHKRNEWMVDESVKILAVWDGSEGGTNNCINYAKKKNKPVVNLYSSYLQLKELNNGK